MNGSYLMGKGISSWHPDDSQTITFIVTEDCNLRCKYCYITHKATNKRMYFEVAKKFIDYILSDAIYHMPAVIIDFIGGEPFLEVELIDKICDYFKLKAFEKNHEWYWNYRFSFSTNGINFGTSEVQQYLKKNLNKVSVGISIDGTKEKHDLQRVFPDGSGSYDEVEKNIPLYTSMFQPATKITFASADLIYLQDSIIDLWNKGITQVSSNVVFENVWNEGDDKVLEEQLKELADYVLDNKLFDKYFCTFFDEHIGGYLRKESLDMTYCGAGKMMALDADGNIYPCLRYKGYSLNHKEEWIIGNINDGIDMERVRPFLVAASKYQDDNECMNCQVATGCGQCQGFSYDEADTDTNFQRAKYICKMHKARVRANDYYFAQLKKRYKIERQEYVEKKQMYLHLADNYVTYCCYANSRDEAKEYMDVSTIKMALDYCYENSIEAILIHPKNELITLQLQRLDEFSTRHIVDPKVYKEAVKIYGDVLPSFDTDSIEFDTGYIKNCIFSIDGSKISDLSFYVLRLMKKADRININILNIDKNFNEAIYEEQLLTIETELVINPEKCIDIINDRVELQEHRNCKAGDRSFAVDVKGNIYTCIGLFESKLEQAIGNVIDGIKKFSNSHLYSEQYQPMCSKCDTYQCRNCIYINKTATREVNVSPSYQCRKSHIERKITAKYIEDSGYMAKTKLDDIDYKDPFETFSNNSIHKFYKYI